MRYDRKHIENALSAIKRLTDNIKTENLTVKWSGWSFTEGNQWDTQQFDLFYDGNLFGKLDLSMDGDYVDLRCEDKMDAELNNIYDFSSKAASISKEASQKLIENLESAICDVLFRDDKEFIDKVGTDENGKIQFPQATYDILRKNLENWLEKTKTDEKEIERE